MGLVKLFEGYFEPTGRTQIAGSWTKSEVLISEFELSV